MIILNLLCAVDLKTELLYCIKMKVNKKLVKNNIKIEKDNDSKSMSSEQPNTSSPSVEIQNQNVYRSSFNEDHKCPECSKQFGTSGKLLQHMFVHSGEKPFHCNHCEKSFSSKFKLMRHSLIHSNERQYQCTYCERCFHRKDHLKNHLQVHNPNKKVHRCDQCNKEYNSRLSFRKHIAIHAAEAGDLNCKVCGKNFDTSEEIMYHLKVHAGSRTIKNPNEKKFKCDHCERRFFTRKDVKRHLVVHTGRRDFLCQFCPQRFGRKDHLVRHIKKSHNSVPSSSCTDKNSTRSRDVTFTEVGSSGFDLSSSLMGQISPCVLLSRQIASSTIASSSKTGFPKLDTGAHSMPSAASTFNLNSLELTHGPAAYSMSEYKNFDDIKVERCDEMVDVLPSSFDIAQLLNYVPVSPHTSNSAVNALPQQMGLPPVTVPSLHPSSTTANTLPRFNQAFQ